MTHSLGHHYRFSSAQQAFEFLFKVILSGDTYQNTRAVFNVVFTLVFPLERDIETPWRKFNKKYADTEYEWYKSGNRNPAMVEKQARIWQGIKDDNDYVNSNYGYWWQRNDQLARVKEMLKTDPSTRRAIIVHYNPDEVQDYNKDTPCNIVLNFYIQQGLLNLTIFARSIDLVYGFCNDQYCFSRLLEDTANDIGIPVGEMTYMITNLHIYDRHFTMHYR